MDLFKVSLKWLEMKNPDTVDIGASQTNVEKECYDLSRQLRTIRKIDYAVELIVVGVYGYCAATGEEIVLNRLENLPIATMCIEAQKVFERGRSHNYRLGQMEVQHEI